MEYLFGLQTYTHFIFYKDMHMQQEVLRFPLNTIDLVDTGIVL